MFIDEISVHNVLGTISVMFLAGYFRPDTTVEIVQKFEMTKNNILFVVFPPSSPMIVSISELRATPSGSNLTLGALV
jgi:hypothetical protein